MRRPTTPDARRGHAWWAALVLAVALTVAGCGAAPAPIAGPTGTLVVTVLLAPTMPVCRADQPCSEPLAHRRAEIVRPDGSVVLDATTDARGQFSVTLAPGPYAVRVLLGPELPGMRQVGPGTVTVAAGQTTTVTVVVDSGIR